MIPRNHRPRCPVCRRNIFPTRHGFIPPHRDTTGHTACPTAGYSYALMEV